MRLSRNLAQKVEKWRRKGDVARLMELLGHQDLARQTDGRVVDRAAETRIAAVAALSQLEGRAATDAVARGLNDPVPAVRSAAIRGLVGRGYADAAPALIPAAARWTEPPLAGLRAEAVEALASFREPELPRRMAAELLDRPAELEDADGTVLRSLVEAAGENAPEATSEYLVLRLREGSTPARIRVLLAALAPESVERLIDALDDPALQREAAVTLGAIHDSRATDPLCGLLVGSEDPAVRSAVAWALGELRDPAAVSALLQASTDEDYDVRVQTIEAFDKLGHVAVAVSLSVYVRSAIEEGVQQRSLADDPTPQVAASTITPDTTATEPPDPAVPMRALSQRDPLGERARPLLRRLLGEPPPA